MSAKIILRQSSIVINNYELGDSPKLEYMFSLWAARFSSHTTDHPHRQSLPIELRPGESLQVANPCSAGPAKVTL